METKFKDMSQEQIKAMSKEAFKAVSPFDKKSCFDCGHLIGAMSHWCGDETAIKVRGTRIPGCIKCPYWKPEWKHIDKKYRTLENGYVKPIEKVVEVVRDNWITRILKKIKIWTYQ